MVVDANDFYLPAGKQPNDSLVDASLWTHVQGFVRTNSAQRPFTGTHSWKLDASKGSLFVVKDNRGNLSLDTLHDTWHNHPMGAAILGGRMWFGDKPDPDEPYVLRSLVVDSWFGTEQAFLPLPSVFQGGGPTMGGGVALAKLASGGYLVVATGPGGNDNPPHTDFFFISATEGASGQRAALGTVAANGQYDMEIFGLPVVELGRGQRVQSSSESQFQWSENISIITECGSGDI